MEAGRSRRGGAGVRPRGPWPPTGARGRPAGDPHGWSDRGYGLRCWQQWATSPTGRGGWWMPALSRSVPMPREHGAAIKRWRTHKGTAGQVASGHGCPGSADP